MVAMTSLAITDEEAALYDRQIRLWGLDSQNRLRNASVLLVGLCGLGAEVAKNLVLAGIKALTLMDSELVVEGDFCSQFLIRRESLGKNRAVASVSKCQLLNPMVAVTAEMAASTEKGDDYFGSFDVVCLIGQPYDEMLRVNKCCRRRSRKFFAGGVFGWFGFSFSDLLEHEYVEEVNVSSADVVLRDENGSRAGEPATKRTKVGESEMKPIEKQLVKKVETFVSMENAFSVDWSTKECRTKLTSRFLPTYFVIQVLFRFKELTGRNPSVLFRDEDVVALLRIRDEVLDAQRIPRERVVVADEFAKHCFAQLSPVCAIVGGVMAQEIIKAVSQKDQPINNFLLVSSFDDVAMVAKFPPSS